MPLDAAPAQIQPDDAGQIVHRGARRDAERFHHCVAQLFATVATPSSIVTVAVVSKPKPKSGLRSGAVRRTANASRNGLDDVGRR